MFQTFRPKKKFPPETIRYHLHKQAEASLSAGIDLREAVKKPPDEELFDWIAVHGRLFLLCLQAYDYLTIVP